MKPTLTMLAELCHAIYLEAGESAVGFPSRFRISAGALRLHDIQVMDRDEVQVAVCRCGVTAIVVVRGTDSPQELLDNFFARLVPDAVVPAVATHRVWGQSASVCDRWLSEITDEFLHFDQVYFVGHSRGGAIAQILSARWAYRGVSAFCLTFGSPRAGDAAFADYLKSNAHVGRIVRSGDGVPLTPSPWRFRHVCRATLINATSQIVFSPGWVTRCWEWVKAAVGHIGTRGLVSLRNHSMKEMAEIVAKAEPSGENVLDRLMSKGGD